MVSLVKILEKLGGCGFEWDFVLGFLRCKDNKAVIDVSLTQLRAL